MSESFAELFEESLNNTNLQPGAIVIGTVVAIENDVPETTDVVERLNPAVERFRARVTSTIAFLPLAAVALAVFAFVVLLGVLLARMRTPWTRIAPNEFIADIYRQIVRLLRELRTTCERLGRGSRRLALP